MPSRITKAKLFTAAGALVACGLLLPNAAPIVTPAAAAASPCGTTQVFITSDISGNGNGDVVELRNNGDIYLLPGKGTGAVETGYLIGAGFSDWTLYFPGDWDGDGYNDMIVINPKTGIMKLLPGDGKGYLQTSRQIGNGWKGYKVIPAGDLNGDGFPDLLAIKEATGDLYLYAGDGKGGFKHPYPKVGWGWKGYDLYAASDVNRDGNADILSIDAKGDLYLYAGKGNGTFKKKVQVGNGWQGFKLAAGADLNGDLMADIVSVSAAGILYYYQAKGGGLFAKKLQIGTGFRADTKCPDTRKWYYLSKETAVAKSGCQDIGSLPVNGQWYTNSVGQTGCAADGNKRVGIAYNLGKNCDLFQATVGIDDRASSGVNLQMSGDVTADGTKLWETKTPIKFGTEKALSLNIKGVLRLELGAARLNGAAKGNNQLVFGDARVRCEKAPGK
ncbi:MAG: FG-GAP-like repeat-containing protein [Micrococcales bacterium]|nr:FG-GAP-like repeat-containing protein [Micrococcales bacterium]